MVQSLMMMMMMMTTNFIYFVHFITLKSNVSIKLITMNKTLISTLAHTLSFESILEDGTRVPKHVVVYVCFLYILYHEVHMLEDIVIVEKCTV